MRYQIAKVPEIGLGLIVEQSAHYAVIEFHDLGHRWQIVVDDDEYTVIEQVGIGFEEIT